MDKIRDGREISVLLSWMEMGRIVVAKHRVYRVAEGKGWVFAAVNSLKRIAKMSPELVSRFLVFELKPYTEKEYLEVATAVLTEREGVKPDLARYIAEKLAKHTRDVRVARSVARLCRTRGEVDEVVKTILKYNSK